MITNALVLNKKVRGELRCSIFYRIGCDLPNISKFASRSDFIFLKIFGKLLKGHLLNFLRYLVFNIPKGLHRIKLFLFFLFSFHSPTISFGERISSVE